MLRVFANSRFRLAVAMMLGAAAIFRLGLLLAQSYSNMDDFRRFIVVPARLAWRGMSPYHRIGVALPRQDLGNLGTFLTPPLMLLLLPWTRLADDPARALWIVAEIIAIAVTLVAVYAGTGRPTMAEALVAILLVVIFPPVVDALQEGQVGLLLSAAFALALLGHQRGRSVPAGVALGVAMAVKLTPVLVLPYFAYRRDWRLCASSLATVAALSLLTLPLGWAHYWPDFLANISSAGNGTALVRNQSLNGVLLRAWHPDWNGLPIAPLDLGVRAAWLALQGLALAGVAVVVSRRRLVGPVRDWAELSTILLLVPLVQPYAWEHHWAQALMVVPVGVFLASRGLLSLGASCALAAIYAADVVLGYWGFVAANSVAPSVLGSSPGLQVAASTTTITAVVAAVLLTTARSNRRLAG